MSYECCTGIFDDLPATNVVPKGGILIFPFFLYTRKDYGNTCLISTNRNMDELAVSEINPTMVAKRTFENILNHIQSSNLNFQLQISPFRANISLKKSLVRDKTGAPLSVSHTCTYKAGDIAAVSAVNLKLENLHSKRHIILENG